MKKISLFNFLSFISGFYNQVIQFISSDQSGEDVFDVLDFSMTLRSATVLYNPDQLIFSGEDFSFRLIHIKEIQVLDDNMNETAIQIVCNKRMGRGERTLKLNILKNR